MIGRAVTTKGVLWTNPRITIQGDWELVSIIDDSIMVAFLIGDIDHLVKS